MRGAQVRLSWADNSTNESGFKVERATGSGSFAQVATTGANATNHLDRSVAINTTYRYRVRAYNSRGHSSYSNTTTVTTAGTGNTAPTISAIASRTISRNGTTGAIAFTIADAQTAASSLILIRNASNQNLVPPGNITFGGSGANRTVTVRPASNQTGWSTIWVKVSDGQLDRYVSFVVTVSSGGSANSAPTISPIAPRTIAMNGSTGALQFTIGDAQTPASSLTLIKNASNQSLVPLANITFGGSGANRTVTVRPAGNKTGWSTIWVKVSDGQLDRYVSFVVTVQASQTLAQTGASSASNMQIAGAAPNSPPAAPTSYDELRFNYTALTGDAELTVRVTSLNGRDDHTRAGLMFRASVAGDAACAGVYVTGSSRLLLVSRPSRGAPLQVLESLTGSVPRWLRLTRVGDTFYGFTSVDGELWEFVEFASVDLSDTALAGTAATAPGGGHETTAGFANFTVD